MSVFMPCVFADVPGDVFQQKDTPGDVSIAPPAQSTPQEHQQERRPPPMAPTH